MSNASSSETIREARCECGALRAVTHGETEQRY